MTEPVRIALIVARARNGVIGKDNELPWHLSDDLKNFKQLTRAKPLIMGRKTWQSLPKRPLPGRPNLVLSRDTKFLAPGSHVFASLEPALAAARSLSSVGGHVEVMIIGGFGLYRDALPIVDRLYLTEVDAAPDGDTVFPDFDEADFKSSELGSWPAGEGNEHAFTIRVLDRILA